MLRIRFKVILSLTFVTFYITFIGLCLQSLKTLPVSMWGKEQRFGRFLVCLFLLLFIVFQDWSKEQPGIMGKKPLDSGHYELAFQLCHLLAMWPHLLNEAPFHLSVWWKISNMCKTPGTQLWEWESLFGCVTLSKPLNWDLCASMFSYIKVRHLLHT